MKRNSIYVLAIGMSITLLAPSITPAAADTRSDIETLMEHVRKHEVVDDAAVLAAPSPEVLAALPKYMDDADLGVRMQSLMLALGVAQRNPALDIQQQVVRFLLQVVESGDTSGVSRWASERLVPFPRTAFTDESRQAVERLMAAPEPSHEVVLLAGVTNLEPAKSKLEKLSQHEDNSGGWFGRPTWAAHLALARMGVASEIDYCIKRVESEKDPVMRVTRLLRNLAYTRQPKAVAVLIKYLMSEERLPSVHATGDGIQQAVYALDLLAQIIEDFPVKSKGIGYTEAQMATARTWVTEHEQLQIKT